jgi:hypothetical protein
MENDNDSLHEVAIFLLTQLMDSHKTPKSLASSKAINTIKNIMAKTRSARTSTKRYSTGSSIPPTPETTDAALSSDSSPKRGRITKKKAVKNNPKGGKKNKMANGKSIPAPAKNELPSILSTVQWDLPRQIECSEYLEIAKTEVGRGVSTTKPLIPAGTVLIVDRPLIHRFNEMPHHNYSERLRAHVESLPAKDKEVFANLAYTDMDDIFEARTETNAFNVAPNRWSLYRYISFINHSCRPNCKLEASTSGDNSFLVRTMVPIPVQGTEITIDYTPETRLHAVETRQQELLHGWKFTCACTACSKPDATNRAREEIAELQNVLRCSIQDDFSKTIKRLPSPQEVTENLLRYTHLLRQERFPDRIPQALERAIHVYKQSGDPEDAERELGHRSQLIELQRVMKGADSEETLKAAEEYIKAFKGMRHSRKESVISKRTVVTKTVVQSSGKKTVVETVGEKVKTGRVEKSVTVKKVSTRSRK